MKDLTALGVAWDAWRAMREGRAGIVARQRARLADLVSVARTHSRFYAERYRELPPRAANLGQLPPVTKPELMARFDEWVTDPAIRRGDLEAFVADERRVGEPYLGRYLVWTTSGTTGVPAILVQDARALAVYTPLSIVRGYLTWIRPQNLVSDVWAILRRRARVATLLATGGHLGGVAMVARSHRRHPRRASLSRIFSVLTPLPRLVEELNAYQPAILHGYATAIALLAEEQLAGRLRIQPVLIGVTAEWLSPQARRLVAAAFGRAPHDAYGSSEAGAIAFDCGRGWLHVNDDWVIVEPVDAAYQPVPPGQTSHTVLVTNLANYVQPIIRYDQGDSVMVSPEPCACGSPLTAIRVDGRTDDILSIRTPTEETVRLLPLALATIVEETPGVHRYQIIQTAPNRLAVRLDARAGAEPELVRLAVHERLRAYLVTQGLSFVEVAHAGERPAPDPLSGKFRHVWADIRPAAPPGSTNAVD